MDSSKTDPASAKQNNVDIIMTNPDTHTADPQHSSITAEASASGSHATHSFMIYDTRPPQNPFVDNNLIAAIDYPQTQFVSLPLPAQGTIKFANFSVNAKGNFANQHWDRTFLCTICNDGTARETTTARQHHTRYHKNQDFETITQEGKKERWKAYNLPKGAMDENS